jgi:hypothetical protein
LPDLDGYEVARRLEAALGGAIRLAAYTSLRSPDDQRQASPFDFASHYDPVGPGNAGGQSPGGIRITPEPGAAAWSSTKVEAL